jgi:hypothetical protein
MDKILGNIINEHKENQMSESAEQEDFVDVLLGLQQSGTVAPQILIVLFLIYLFDNIIQLISLRSLWYYGGW